MASVGPPHTPRGGGASRVGAPPSPWGGGVSMPQTD